MSLLNLYESYQIDRHIKTNQKPTVEETVKRRRTVFAEEEQKLLADISKNKEIQGSGTHIEWATKMM